MESPMSKPTPKSAQLFQCLITSYLVRQQLFDNLTPYSVACLLHIFKIQLGNDVGTVEKERFLNPMRCLFDKIEIGEIEERIKKGHAIVVWGKDLELMTRLLQNPEPPTHEGWPKRISLAINEFSPEESEFLGRLFLPGHWKRVWGERYRYTKETTPEPGIQLHDMTRPKPRTLRMAKHIVICSSHSIYFAQKEIMSELVHLGENEDLFTPKCQLKCGVPYLNIHEKTSILKRVKGPDFVVNYMSPAMKLRFEIEVMDMASPTLEDTVEMRQAWSEGRDPHLQQDTWTC